MKKIVVITGASGGIGRAVARKFAASGAFVVLHANQNTPLAEKDLAEIQKTGGRGVVVSADFNRPSDRERFLNLILRQNSKIDVWVNAAGVDLMSPALKALSFEEKMRQLLEVDVIAAIELSRRVGFCMKEQGGGTLFFFGWDGVEYGWEGETAQLYGAAKGAISGFCRCLAESLAPEVRIRHLALGWIKTRWGQKASEEFDRRIVESSLQRRWGNPEEVAEVVSFLADDVSNYVDGLNIRINGGKHS